MAYIKDKDLEFLANCNNDDLDILVKYLINDKNGSKRMSQGLTSKSLYRKYSPDHIKYWENIAEELQLYGGNTILSFFRGDKGVTYRVILKDVCKRFNINYDESKNTEDIESELLKKILNDSIDKMSPDELNKLVEALDISTSNITKDSIKEIISNGWGVGSKSLGVVVAGLIATAVAARFGLIIISSISLTAAGIGATALNLLLGPIGLMALAGNTLTGPAYRVTIPAVIQIAYMRMISKV